MQNYELTVVLKGDASIAKKKAVQEKIEKIVVTLKGKVEKIDEWGKIDLTQKIRGETSGIFLHFALELDAEGVKVLPEKIKIEDDIIRYLLIKKLKN